MDQGAMMRLPVIRGVIDRRILVNYRVDPDVMARIVPSPFRPQIVGGYAIAGICLIRLRRIRPHVGCRPFWELVLKMRPIASPSNGMSREATRGACTFRGEITSSSLECSSRRAAVSRRPPSFAVHGHGNIGHIFNRHFQRRWNAHRGRRGNRFRSARNFSIRVVVAGVRVLFHGGSIGYSATRQPGNSRRPGTADFELGTGSARRPPCRIQLLRRFVDFSQGQRRIRLRIADAKHPARVARAGESGGNVVCESLLRG